MKMAMAFIPQQIEMCLPRYLYTFVGTISAYNVVYHRLERVMASKGRRLLGDGSVSRPGGSGRYGIGTTGGAVVSCLFTTSDIPRQSAQADTQQRRVEEENLVQVDELCPTLPMDSSRLMEQPTQTTLAQPKPKNRYPLFLKNVVDPSSFI